ncbi:hypothetical protein GALL_154260 [mine drainage metagenome]|uniref:Phosphate-selective porin O and P n=1 Tax=mine drainage metagenome TaxID=410659 RepID=A0A1J5S381_9ZZZZ
MHLFNKCCLSALLIISVITPAWAGEYHLGEGYSVGDINIAGYVNVVAEAPHDGKTQVVGDDLSLFVSGRFNRYLNPFIEAEFTSATLWHQSSTVLSDNHPVFVLERLYNDSNLTDNLTLRIGKMLSPIGEWNTIHASPLVWTTTRPMTTYRSFPEYTSGVGLNYSSQNTLLPDLQLFWQPDGEIRARPRDLVTREYEHTEGVHLNWAIGLTDKVGVTLQHADIKDSNEDQTLLGFNFRKTLGKFQFETEATHTHVNGSNPARVRDDEWGAYLLGGYAINDKWSTMLRYEYFADRQVSQGSRNALVGLVWRPDPAIFWKLEYVKQDGARLNIGTGIYASFSVLF